VTRAKGGRAAELAARAAAVQSHAARDVEQPTAGSAPARAGSAPLRTAPVRLTVDLPPVMHRQLRGWCRDTADALGVTNVAMADAVKVLVDLMLADDQLAERVRTGLPRR
jgi:hypothetical protein